MGLGGVRTGSPTGHHFLLLLGAVGGKIFGDDICILEEHITDGLQRIQMGVRIGAGVRQVHQEPIVRSEMNPNPYKHLR